MKTENILTPMNAAGGSAANSLPTQVILETARGAHPIPLESRSFDDGIIYISGAIDDALACRLILLFQLSAKEHKDLTVYINSPGGAVTAGLAILDAMQAYPYSIKVICAGVAASMAAVLLAGGRKGQRCIMPHSQVMIHEPLIAGGLGGSATSIQRTAESIIETKKILNGLLAKFTGRTLKEIDKNTAFDNFFNAKEAIEFGLCDKIVTGFEDMDED